MKRIWIAAATVALLGFGAAVVTASEGGSGGATTAATGTTTETQTQAQTTGTTTTEDRPRRERDPERGRDDGVQAPGPPPAGTAGAVDISGPCDEAEHANDPRCTGGAVRADDDADDHGRGRGHDDRGEDDHDDRGHDDRDDDSSGPGGNSGPGGDDRD